LEVSVVRCWSCQAEVPEREAFCAGCGKVQPLDPKADHFATMGLPRSFGVEEATLEARFRELSRKLHPDRFARADPRERRFSLERSTRVNDAYRVLKDERRRAEYLLSLAGHDPVAEGKTLHDPEFLEEQLAVREALEEAKAAGDHEHRRKMAVETRARLAALYAELRTLFAASERGDPAALAAAARLVARARYYDNVVAEAEGTRAEAQL
jgi:molecular chaperone HscB